MDVRNEEKSSVNGSTVGGSDALPELLVALLSQMQVMATELRKYHVVMARQNRILMSLVEQNASMVEMFVQEQEDDDDVPGTYLDGTPILKS